MADFTGVVAVLPASDLEASTKFFEGTVGLTRVDENPGGVIYRVGGQTLFVYITDQGGGGATRIILTVDDVAAAVADLKARGVTFEVYPDLPMATWEGEVALYTDPSGNTPPQRAAWFLDPAGNVIAIGDNM